MYDLRLFISKKGRIKFVSHLDMFRLMQRAVRRAEIPLWYTEGFNPHPYISFLLALSLGVESEGEPVDIRIVGDMTPDEVKDRLNKCMPEGLLVESAVKPFNKSAEIAFGEYDVLYSKDDINENELFEALSSGSLTCEKSGKSGGKKVIKTVNVSEHIKSFVIGEEGDDIMLKVVLPAGSTFNLNPIQLSQAVSSYLGKEVIPVRVLRTALLCSDMKKFS
ncbi:MAG: TIGR03936 family radical SAM-associated protein [Clostridia bacterium]|nr:TIGR03936 family radical SAM-associated protein [Clostridia bacterium]